MLEYPFVHFFASDEPSAASEGCVYLTGVDVVVQEINKLCVQLRSVLPRDPSSTEGEVCTPVHTRESKPCHNTQQMPPDEETKGHRHRTNACHCAGWLMVHGKPWLCRLSLWGLSLGMCGGAWPTLKMKCWYACVFGLHDF